MSVNNNLNPRVDYMDIDAMDVDQPVVAQPAVQAPAAQNENMDADRMPLTQVIMLALTYLRRPGG